ncbi:epidermal growth factor receptor kinase substrate 8-like isoform X2 [Bradysia coprophila]|uniref:epidermal growth factor receptor kinase substrate 8-like isoform X2 n=1 Tax=Bradysia coprophila TaxID=38358 RepID=UPI00187D744D|nr:epidermal growth factor receptor kinase substrate 8-like isoform X2 [Bradysia coprophila]
MAYRSNGYSEDERDSRSGDDRPGSDLGDKPTYLLEHLATFTVNKESGIVYPADGMRRLLQLEKTTGIWSQKMQLCLDRQWVLIMDYETGNIIERFPASLIQEPTAFTSNSTMEMYNNILVIIVGGSSSRSEMHIFQCQSISAVHLVEDLKQLRSGKIVTQHRESLPPPPPAKPAQQSRDIYNYHETDSEIDGLNDETSSTSSEKYERDVTVLNHCFDDIEKFIARLQHAAAASRELERRRRNRKSKKKDPGEGLLTMRTKPPHEREFVDIFSKFKLSFNLLAKLKAHIHDPNAPELVHFLFTPLALIVDASHDTYYDPNIPARVINPLLTHQAINLLINCVTSKEHELWKSLGDAWTIPREEWKGHVGAYHPTFFDGWSPDFSVMDELDHPSTPTIKRRIEPHIPHFNGSGDYDYDHHPPDKYNSPSSPTGVRDFSTRSEISVDSIERVERVERVGHSNSVVPIPIAPNSNHASHANHANHELSPADERWIGDVQARGGKLVQVTYPRTANNDKELTVVRGEYLEILDDTRKWWKARNSRGQCAHVPHTIVAPFAYTDAEDDDVFNNPLYAQNYNKNNFNRQSHVDPAPDRYSNQPDTNASPSSHLPPNAQADWIRNKHTARKSIASVSGQDEVNEELKNVLTLFREKRRVLDIVKTPEIFIQQSSSATEVEQWLKAKGFSDRVVKKMHGLNGNELFALKRHTLEDYCGSEEGRRLASQITIQRNISGYKTARSSELQALLAKARKKTDAEVDANA